MNFRLELELGNDAMQTPDDVARALRALADRLDGCIWGEPRECERIGDDNGNTVGTWEFTS